MDLTTTVPRSPKEKMDGIFSLARVTDKARAHAADTLGEYDFNCPHDKPVFEFLGTDADTFEKKAVALDDAALAKWVEDSFLSKKTAQEIAAFNEARLNWRPEPGSPSAAYYQQLREKVAPGRNDVVTWFDMLDLDEKRPVPKPQP